MTARPRDQAGQTNSREGGRGVGLSHIAFVERLAGMTDQDPMWRQTVAGFLTMRAVDAWRRQTSVGSESRVDGHPSPAGIGVARAIGEIEVQHAVRLALYHVVEALGETTPAAPHPVLVRLISYGRALEFDAEWTLAIDVHQEVLEHAERARDGYCAGQAALRLGFGHRVLARHDAALTWYSRAEQIGTASGDPGTALRARIGVGKLALDRGNYAEARTVLEDVMRTAEAAGLAEERSFALHELSDIAFRAGDHARALRLLHGALGGYTVQADLDRALNDLAVNFVELGLLDAARDAYMVVLATAQEQATRWLAMVNLLAVVGRAGDRAAVERYRRELTSASLPPGLEYGFWSQLGAAYVSLGENDEAGSALAMAVAVARKHGLHGREFEAEREIAELSGSIPERSRPVPVALPEALEAAGAVRHMRLQVYGGAEGGGG